MGNRGLIFNIQRYSLNDGAGIRTIVFFKGCELRCPWCSNPESQKKQIEIMNKKISDNSNGKFEEIGKWYKIDELLKEVLKDEVFFNSSNGGVTLSGGEVLNQADFAIEFLKELKEHGVNTAIETCGFGDKNNFLDILKYTDTVLFDLKILDDEKSLKVINGKVSIILENLKLAASHGNVIVRFPYIPDFTDSQENINEIMKVMKEYNIVNIDILPYHNYGSKKYEYLGREYLLKDLRIPTTEEIENIKKIMEKSGFKVNIGG